VVALLLVHTVHLVMIAAAAAAAVVCLSGSSGVSVAAAEVVLCQWQQLVWLRSSLYTRSICVARRTITAVIRQ
jgi:hypothetical protein